MKYFIKLKCGSVHRKSESTGVVINGTEREAVAYALGYHRAINSLSPRKIIVLVQNENGGVVYEKT